MYCGSKRGVNRSSARSTIPVRRFALHRLDPRRPRPIYARAPEISFHFAPSEAKPR